MPLPQELDLGAGADVASPVSRLSNLIIAEALRTRAGAIRLEAVNAERGEVVFEQDGEWRKVMEVPMPAFRPVINHFMVTAGLSPGGEAAQAGELPVRHEGTRHVLRVRTEVTASNVERLVITGIAGTAP